jgi:hypothetical protein
MPEVINYEAEEAASRSKGIDSIIAFVLLEAMTRAAEDARGEDGDDSDAFTALWGPDFDASKLEVCLTVNGREVPFRYAFNLIEEQFGRLVAEKALELVKERVGNLFYKVETAAEEVETQLVGVLQGDRDALFEELRMEILPWEAHENPGMTLWHRHRRDRSLKPPAGSVTDVKGQQSVVWRSEDEEGVAPDVDTAKALVDWKLGIGEQPEGIEV